MVSQPAASLPDGDDRRTLAYEPEPIASGGMATVHVGKLVDGSGVARAVAVKRLHAELAHDPNFVTMFIDEARLARRIRHPNVVSTLDVVRCRGELLLIMEYVPGLSLAALLASPAHDRLPLAVVSGILVGVLR